MSMGERVRVGVGCVVWRDGKVLIGKRIGGKHGDQEYSFPGGKPDGGESPALAAKRELFEETGLYADVVTPIPVWTYDVFPEHDLHYVTLYFLMKAQGEAVNTEPDKCAGWDWYAPDEVPEPLFCGVEAVVKLLAQEEPTIYDLADAMRS
jgi:8-oxo-dGTP diphosphatase